MFFWDIFRDGRGLGDASLRLAVGVLLAIVLVSPTGLAGQSGPARLTAAPARPADASARPTAAPARPAAAPARPTAARRAAGASRFRFEPWAGALWDAYRNDGGDGRPAWIGAARFGFELGELPAGHGVRLIGEVAHAEAAEAGTAVLQDTLEVGFRTDWWLATAGVEWDLVGGWTGLSLDGRAGAAWIEREIVAGDTIPSGTPGTSARPRAKPFPALAFGVSAWRHLSHTIQVRVRLEDVVTDPFDALEHSPALGLGVRFVFE